MANLPVDLLNLPEVQRLANIVRTVDDILTVNWISVTNDDYKRAINDLISFNIKIAMDPAVNGGGVFLEAGEVGILNTLLSGHIAGPKARAVLEKLGRNRQ